MIGSKKRKQELAELQSQLDLVKAELEEVRADKAAVIRVNLELRDQLDQANVQIDDLTAKVKALSSQLQSDRDKREAIKNAAESILRIVTPKEQKAKDKPKAAPPKEQPKTPPKNS